MTSSNHYNIRLLDESHAADVSDLVSTKIEEFSQKAIDLKSLRFFVKFSNKNFVVEKMENGEYLLWGCYDKKKLVGLLGIGRICNVNVFFIEENEAELEIANALFQTMLFYCKRNRKCQKIKANAPIFTKLLFKKLGFQEVGSVTLRNGCVAMEYKINR